MSLGLSDVFRTGFTMMKEAWKMAYSKECEEDFLDRFHASGMPRCTAFCIRRTLHFAKFYQPYAENRCLERNVGAGGSSC